MLKTQQLVLSVFAISCVGVSLAAGQQKVIPNAGLTFDANIDITTARDGMSTYISVVPQGDGNPLQAGFRVDYSSATSSSINFAGPGHLLFSKEENVATEHPLAVTVKTNQGECWIFKVDTFGGGIPRNCTEVKATGGLAHIWWSDSQKQFPRTHGEFVAAQVAAQQMPLDSCSCSGGCGATQCSCQHQGGGGCSVTCTGGKEACCNGGCHCPPPCLLPSSGSVFQGAGGGGKGEGQ